jgi:hypothetical protein
MSNDSVAADVHREFAFSIRGKASPTMTPPAPDETHPPEDPLGEEMVRDAARRFARGPRKYEGPFALLLNRTQRIYEAHRRRAIRACVLLNYTHVDLRGVIQRALCTRMCAFCGRELEFDTFAVTYKNPPRRGGRHNLANLMVCCRICRALKGPLDAQEFRELTHVMEHWPKVVRRRFIARLGIGRHGQPPRPPRAA